MTTRFSNLEEIYRYASEPRQPHQRKIDIGINTQNCHMKSKRAMRCSRRRAFTPSSVASTLPPLTSRSSVKRSDWFLSFSSSSHWLKLKCHRDLFQDGRRIVVDLSSSLLASTWRFCSVLASKRRLLASPVLLVNVLFLKSIPLLIY